jgi:hypothetical protein
MSRSMLGAVLTVCGLPAAANAQQIQATISYQLTFSEVLAGTTTPGNGNGVIEPGEAAHLRLTAHMTPAVGTTVPIDPTMFPGWTAGTLRGIMSIFLDLHGSNDAQGDWSHLRIDPVWDLLAGAGNGTPFAGGTQLRNIQAGQFPYSVGIIMTTNPLVDVWQGVWTPQAYDPRMVVFETVNGNANPTPFAGSALVRTGGVTFLPGTVSNGFTSIQIPIIPAPSTATAVLLGCLLVVRRRR